MKKLYRLVGAAGMCFRAFGVTVGVRVSESNALETLNSCLPPGSRRCHTRRVSRLYSFYINRKEQQRGIRRLHAVYRDHQLLRRSENAHDLYEEFERDAVSYIAATSTTRLFVHAGVVGWNGRAIVIPGRSYSGKTTLVAEFLRRGATYYSDEFALFDGSGYVHPFSRPLGIRGDVSDQQTKKLAQEFGARIGSEALPVGLVLLTEYDKSRRWRPREASRGRAVLKLLANSLSARRNPVWAIRVLTQASEKARVRSGLRGEANEVVRSVQENFKSWPVAGVKRMAISKGGYERQK